MKRPTTFSRLMIVFITVIAICVITLMGIFYFTMRDVQIQNRMNALKIQAYDIAYLSGTMETSGLEAALGLRTTTRQMLFQKLRSVYEDYSAYCLVFDSSGNVISYITSILDENEELRSSFDANHIRKLLINVLSGKEVMDQIQTSRGTMFTVAVPLKRGDSVMGAVYIQTAAQSVRASYEGLVAKVALTALASVLVAALMVFLYTRRFSKPLREIAHTSTSMAAGDFSNRVTEEGTKEIYDMAVAFNTMAGKLSETEQVRRDFIANLSHELRSPMTNIRGFIQGILDGTIPQAESGHYLEIVLNETNRLTKLVTGLLNLSRIENSDIPLEMSCININELIRLVLITKVSQIEQKELDVRLNFIEEVSTVRCDRDQIEQVLINLIDNAIKFTPNGGVIQITTGYISSDTLSVTVRDNGIGVLKQDAAYIFDRFYKADKAHAPGSGTGLGLSISKMILEKHGQHIELLDSEDGAAFRFTLQRVNGHEGSK